MNTRKGQNQLIPFLWLRRAIGFSGILFPLVLITGVAFFGDCSLILQAISDYYHSIMRDVFVAMLCMLSIFLFTYRGPERKDNWASNIAGLSALGIAFFPTSVKACDVWHTYEFPVMHNLSAMVFFLTLTYMSLFLFTKTGEGETPTPEKLMRNSVYRFCGYLMLVSIALVGLQMTLLNKLEGFRNLPLIFIFEWVALWAFGISWIVKGELVMEDH